MYLYYTKDGGKKMDEKKEIKISLSTFLLILALLVIVVMAFFMYQLYNDKEIANNKVSALNSVSENATAGDDNQDSNNAIALDIESSLVKKLYNYVEKFNCYKETLVYQSNKVTENDLTNQLKLLTIFDNLDENDVSRTEYRYENEYITSNEHRIYSKDTIEKRAKEIFGENVSITHESFEPIFGESVVFANNEYDRYSYQGGGGTPWESSANILVSAEKYEDGTICIYDKYVHLVEVNGSYDIYSSSDKKEKLASNVDSTIIHGSVEGTQSSDLEKQRIQNVEKYLGKELPTYKHTFKQNSDGTYYWYSTEQTK